MVTHYQYKRAGTNSKTSITVSQPTPASGSIHNVAHLRLARQAGANRELPQRRHRSAVRSLDHNVTASYSYDPAGNLRRITDSGEKNQLQAVYDDLGRKTEVDDPTAGPGSTPGTGWQGCARRRMRAASRSRIGTTDRSHGGALHAAGRRQRRFVAPRGELAVRPERQARHRGRDARRRRHRP